MLVVLVGCDGAGGGTDAGRDAARDTPPDLPCTATATPSRRVVTADWLNRSLTIFGVERLLDPGCSAEEARVGTVDLAAYAPGPIEVEISPAAPVALVAVGPGFYEGAGVVLVGASDPAAEGTLLVVDLDARVVLGEIELAAVPMGMAFSPDGTRAYVAEYGVNAAHGDAVAVIDVTTRTLLSEVVVGSRPEQIALSSDGTIGAVSIDDGVRTFETADLAGTLSPILSVGNDPSGVGFAVGTRRLVVTNSMSASVSLVDATDASVPVLVASPPVPGAPYGVTPLDATDVLVSTSFGAALVRLDAFDAAAASSSVELLYGGYLLNTVVVDGFAITAHPARHLLSVADLASGEAHAVEWLTEVGPTYVAVETAP